MKIWLEKQVGLKGADVVKSWRASVINESGQTVITETAVTANGALREIELKLREALRAVEEMKSSSPSSDKSTGTTGYSG